jgi:ribosomal protein S18 acetylase RimI-like enzyme
VTLAYAWRGAFDNEELNALHAEAFEGPLRDDEWRGQVEGHSLGWVCARDGERLVGFVNVAWDGGVHAFVLDTIVAASARRRGIATRMVGIALEEARRAGCEWIHVDFDEDLAPFYFDACGFRSTPAGVIELQAGSNATQQ